MGSVTRIPRGAARRVRSRLLPARRRRPRLVGREALAWQGLRELDARQGIREYQPLYGLSEKHAAAFPRPRRLVDERWQAIAAHLPSHGTAMDVGCQHGWFTFKLAEQGLHAVGIEQSGRAFRTAQWLTVYNGAERAAFLKFGVAAETVDDLPAVDVVLCMAIFHHWVLKQGRDAAVAIMQSLADRCRDRMFFESGQIGDATSAERDHLGFMGEDPRAWMEDFLRSLGFREVIDLGQLARATTNERPRYLLLATK